MLFKLAGNSKTSWKGFVCLNSGKILSKLLQREMNKTRNQLRKTKIWTSTLYKKNWFETVAVWKNWIGPSIRLDSATILLEKVVFCTLGGKQHVNRHVYLFYFHPILIRVQTSIVLKNWGGAWNDRAVNAGKTWLNLSLGPRLLDREWRNVLKTP